MKLGVTRPFDEESGPAEFDGGPDFAKQAFELTADKPFPDQSIVGENAVYLIALQNRIPDEILPLEQIRDQVTAACRMRQAVLLARSAGEDFARAAAGGLAQGRKFAAICADARSDAGGSAPVFPQHPRTGRSWRIRPPSASSSRSRSRCRPGASATSLPRATGGGAVFQGRLPLNETKMKAEMPGFINYLRRARAQEAFNLWFGREGSVALRDTPLAAQRKTAESPGGARRSLRPARAIGAVRCPSNPP